MIINEDLLIKIVDTSAESELIDCNIHGSKTHVILHNPFIAEMLSENVFPGDNILLEFKSNYYYSNFEFTNPRLSPCFFRLYDLRKELTVNQWGYYIPATNKDRFFREIKDGLSLAYGKHFQKYQWIFAIKSNPDIFRVLLSSLDDINITMIKSQQICSFNELYK